MAEKKLKPFLANIVFNTREEKRKETEKKREKQKTNPIKHFM